MNAFLDPSTCELASTQLKLRDELVFVPQRHAGTMFYHIEVPSQAKFYRIGYPEYVFISLLDGRTSFAQAMTIASQALGVRALSQAKAMQVYVWLLEHGLAHFADGPQRLSRAKSLRRRSAGRSLTQLNPFWMRVPLLRPDRLLAALVRYVGWLFSPWATLVGIALIAAGTGVVASQWDRFVASSNLIFAPHNWLWMSIAWIALKAVHEVAHGLVCKRYDGEVREMGLVFVLFAPMAYVDVTTSWRFPSKWQRIHVAAAGMYLELLLAAFAAMLWAQTSSAWFGHFLYAVILMASVSTVLFNANPLMRFDGYYILADLLEIPNLCSDGMQSVRRTASWWFLGTTPDAPRTLGYRGRLAHIYGLAASVWQVVVCASLTLAASVLLKGAGLVLAIAGIACWFGMPLWRGMKSAWQMCHEAPHRLVRATALATTLAGVVFAAAGWLPWPGGIPAPAVVDYRDMSIVRNRVPGFVERIHVAEGQHVEAGELLVELRNDDLASELADLRLALDQALARHRVALDEQDPAEAQVALRNHQAVQERFAEVQRRHDALQVRAPCRGRIVARNLDARLGTYCDEGHELLAVGDESQKELVVTVRQQDVEEVLPLLGKGVRFRIGPGFAHPGTLKRITPLASNTLPHPALSSTVGGPLAVRETDDRERRDVELLEPHFKAVVTLPAPISRCCVSGQRGHAVFGWQNESVGEHLARSVSEWVRERLKPLRAN